jgi:hypothetical protein
VGRVGVGEADEMLMGDSGGRTDISSSNLRNLLRYELGFEDMCSFVSDFCY